MIVDLMDPTNYNDNHYKDRFLANMYRIVRCCGADSYNDYPHLFNISPPEECINWRSAGGLYYEDGCSEDFLVWLRAWAGGVSAGIFIAMGVIIFSMIIASRLIKYYKGLTLLPLQQQQECYDDKPLPPVPPHASVVTFGGTTTKEVPRTLRKEVSLEPYVPTPPRTRKSKTQQSPSLLKHQKQREYERNVKYAEIATHQQQQQPSINHVYMPSPPSKPRRIDDKLQRQAAPPTPPSFHDREGYLQPTSTSPAKPGRRGQPSFKHTVDKMMDMAASQTSLNYNEQIDGSRPSARSRSLSRSRDNLNNRPRPRSRSLSRSRDNLTMRAVSQMSLDSIGRRRGEHPSLKSTIEAALSQQIMNRDPSPRAPGRFVSPRRMYKNKRPGSQSSLHDTHQQPQPTPPRSRRDASSKQPNQRWSSPSPSPSPTRAGGGRRSRSGARRSSVSGSGGGRRTSQKSPVALRRQRSSSYHELRASSSSDAGEPVVNAPKPQTRRRRSKTGAPTSTPPTTTRVLHFPSLVPDKPIGFPRYS